MKRTIAISLILGLTICFLSSAGEPAYPPAAEVKKAFLKLLDRPKVAADVKVTQAVDVAALKIHQEVLTIASEKKASGDIERVPIVLVRPLENARKRPTVLVLHGLGGNKESVVPFLIELAGHGMVGVSFDARYHGARAGPAGAAAYNQALIKAWRTNGKDSQEYPLFYDTCWDIWRTLDYLQTRPDVDADKIGMVGISMGGVETWLAGAVDERVKVAVPAISVECVKWTIEKDKWQGGVSLTQAAHQQVALDLGKQQIDRSVCEALCNKVLPGFMDQFDCPSMIRLYAGRPLLILNGETDPIIVLGGAQLAFKSAEEAYKAAAASDKLRIEVAKGVGHTVTDGERKMAMEWLDKYLK